MECAWFLGSELRSVVLRWNSVNFSSSQKGIYRTKKIARSLSFISIVLDYPWCANAKQGLFLETSVNFALAEFYENLSHSVSIESLLFFA